jgi:hypothetical protein
MKLLVKEMPHIDQCRRWIFRSKRWPICLNQHIIPFSRWPGDRYNFVPGTSVCLTNGMKKGKERGKNNGMKSVRDTTNERMLAQNVSNKEKSEYVKIWKLLMDKYKEQGQNNTKYLFH